MVPMDPHYERLLKLVSEARKHRGLDKQADLIKASGLSRSTARRFERGESVDETSLRKISRAVGWTPDSAQDVLEGGEPTPAPAAPDSTAYYREPASEEDRVAVFRNAVFDAFVTSAPDTPISAISEIADRLLEAARAAGFGAPRRRQDTHNQDDPET